MTSTNVEMHENKYLLVWPMPVSNEVQSLFTRVFLDVFELIDYIYKVFKDTRKFHLNIPLNCFEELRKNPIYQFPQVTQIRVIGDSINDIKWIKHRFSSECEKVEFCTIYDLLGLLDEAEQNNAFAPSSSPVRSIRNAIISLIEARISIKESDRLNRRFQIQNRLACTSLFGYPVQNILDFAPCFICSWCMLVYQQVYQLECKHQLCQVCINILKNCTTCFQAISYDKVLLNENIQIKMQDLVTHCSYCDWMQPLKDYELHVKQNHNELITCFIYNLEIDESTFYQQYLTEENQENSANNLSSSKLNRIVTSLNGTCIWEISDIENIINNVMNNGPKSIYSTALYIYPNSYKMCMKLCINEDCQTKTKHISLSYVIMRGEYDDKLQWPFKYKTTFTLIDQLNQNHISDSCWPNIKEKCFQRPITDMNDDFGILKFISQDILEQHIHRFSQHNTMYIKIKFSLLAINSSK